MTTKRKTKNDKTFFEISNDDVYNKLLDIEKNINKQNSKIKLNTWLASTSFTLIAGLVIAVINHVII